MLKIKIFGDIYFNLLKIKLYKKLKKLLLRQRIKKILQVNTFARI